MNDKPKLELIHNPRIDSTFEEAYGLINDPKLPVNVGTPGHIDHGMYIANFARAEQRAVAHLLGLAEKPSKCIVVVGTDFYSTGKGRLFAEILEEVKLKTNCQIIVYGGTNDRRNVYPKDIRRSVIDYYVEQHPLAFDRDYKTLPADQQKGPKGPRGKWGKLK